jgi:hypothetical protein
LEICCRQSIRSCLRFNDCLGVSVGHNRHLTPRSAARVNELLRPVVRQIHFNQSSNLRVRILVTAKDAPTLFDLRCLVREAMVVWVQQTMPAALPVQRVMVTEPAPTSTHDTDAAPAADGLFTGNADAERRAQTFTNAIPTVDTDPR